LTNYQKAAESVAGTDADSTGTESTGAATAAGSTGTGTAAGTGSTETGSTETGAAGAAHVSNPSDKPYPYAAPYTNHICVMAATNVAKITIPPERAAESESFNEIVLGTINARINTKTVETINPYAIDHKNVYPTALALPIIVFLKCKSYITLNNKRFTINNCLM
jgi:hypothetical protein